MMEYDGLKVTTKSGFVCTFYYNEDEEILWAICFNDNGLFQNEVKDGSIGELKEGELLRFRYYAGMNTETFTSETPIVSIENIYKD